MKRALLPPVVLVLLLFSVTAAHAGSFTVTANPLWTSTGIVLTGAETVTISGATGWWSWGGFWPEGVLVPVYHGPEGDINTPHESGYLNDEWVPNYLHGMLIGYIGDNPELVRTQQWPVGMFAVGTATVVVSGTGTLWLGFNDDRTSNAIGDNAGTVTVNVQVPDPALTLLLFGMGLTGLAAWRRRRQ